MTAAQWLPNSNNQLLGVDLIFQHDNGSLFVWT